MTVVIILFVFFSQNGNTAGLYGKKIIIGEKVECVGWPDYEKVKSQSNKRFILGEILEEDSGGRIRIYGKILNPLNKRDTYTTPFLLLKKMCLYYDDFQNLRKIRKIEPSSLDEVKIAEEVIIEQKQESLLEKNAQEPTSDLLSKSLFVSADNLTIKAETVIEQPDLVIYKPELDKKKRQNYSVKTILKEVLISILILSSFGLLYGSGWVLKIGTFFNKSRSSGNSK